MTGLTEESVNHSPQADAEAAVSVQGLTKTYAASGKTPAKTALHSIDLDVPRGMIFGLLGPNGAGKSTLINILAGLTIKTAGSASIWGYDIDQQPRMAKAAIGVVPQELNIDPYFTPVELLDIQAGLYGVPKRERRSMDLLRALGLDDKAGSYTRSLSGGMRRRLMVAKAMVHSPPVLVLDEPTAGVDIELRQQLWTHVRALNESGTTVLLTTHYLEEAEELCDRIAIINHGRVVADDTTPNLLAQLDSKTLTVNLTDPLDQLPSQLSQWQAELPDPHKLLIRYRPSETRLGEILNAMNEGGITVSDLSTEETDLQDIFLQLTRADDAA